MDNKPLARKYKRAEITVTYQPRRCTHVAECLRRAPNVFDTWNQPWVQVENGTLEEIIDAVERCPTGALHYERTDGGAQEQPTATNVVFVARNGPYYVRGDLEIVMPDGSALRETRAALCRCGASQHYPFCDNTHREIQFRDAGVYQSETNAHNELASHQKLRITPQPNGNLKFEGAFEIRDARGQIIFRGERRRLCRCGHSNDKPFCDDAHERIGFKTKAPSHSNNEQ
ncbi:MAG: hypothetical protein EYC68_21705 [Chloroflexota bacterium]|nr:MAG: hypothetical protein EYC68_21705 [Chloroflexota bacterium]